MTYEPELGQVLFGQPYKEHVVPEIWEAALSMIREEMDRVMWNINQKQYENPFGNTGNSFDCDVFSVHAYSWDEEIEQPWNFKHHPTGVKISWYKYLGRGMSANKELSPSMASDILIDCLGALRKMEQ